MGMGSQQHGRDEVALLSKQRLRQSSRGVLNHSRRAASSMAASMGVLMLVVLVFHAKTVHSARVSGTASIEPGDSVVVLGRFAFDVTDRQTALNVLLLNSSDQSAATLHVKASATGTMGQDTYIVLVSDEKDVDRMRKAERKGSVNCTDVVLNAAIQHSMVEAEELEARQVIWQASRPRFWFVVAARCQEPRAAPTTVQINYVIRFKNPGGYFEKEFGVDQQFELQIMLGFVGALLAIIGWSLSILLCTRFVEKAYKRHGHLALFASDGVGIRGVDTLGDILGAITTTAIMALLLGLVDGIMLCKRAPPARRRMQSAIFAAALMFLAYVGAFVNIAASTGPADILYLYDSVGGIVALCVRFLLMIWFIVAAAKRLNIEEIPERRAFLSQLIRFTTMWFVLLPVGIIVSLVLAPWVREKIVSTIDMTSMTVMLYGLCVMFHPERVGLAFIDDTAQVSAADDLELGDSMQATRIDNELAKRTSSDTASGADVKPATTPKRAASEDRANAEVVSRPRVQGLARERASGDGTHVADIDHDDDDGGRSRAGSTSSRGRADPARSRPTSGRSRAEPARSRPTSGRSRAGSRARDDGGRDDEHRTPSRSRPTSGRRSGSGRRSRPTSGRRREGDGRSDYQAVKSAAKEGRGSGRGGAEQPRRGHYDGLFDSDDLVPGSGSDRDAAPAKPRGNAPVRASPMKPQKPKKPHKPKRSGDSDSRSDFRRAGSFKGMGGARVKMRAANSFYHASRGSLFDDEPSFLDGDLEVEQDLDDLKMRQAERSSSNKLEESLRSIGTGKGSPTNDAEEMVRRRSGDWNESAGGRRAPGVLTREASMYKARRPSGPT